VHPSRRLEISQLHIFVKRIQLAIVNARDKQELLQAYSMNAIIKDPIDYRHWPVRDYGGIQHSRCSTYISLSSTLKWSPLWPPLQYILPIDVSSIEGLHGLFLLFFFTLFLTLLVFYLFGAYHFFGFSFLFFLLFSFLFYLLFAYHFSLCVFLLFSLLLNLIFVLTLFCLSKRSGFVGD